MKNPRSSCPVEILSIMRMNVAPEFIILTGIVKVARWLSYKNPELLTIHEHMGSSKMAPCKVECHVETLCSSSRLATEEFEDTKGVIRICILKKNRQHNGQKKKYKRTNNDLQKYTYKTKDWVTQTPLKIGGDLGCSGRVSSSCSTNDIRRVNLVTNLW
jgi:hypothetical protein